MKAMEKLDVLEDNLVLEVGSNGEDGNVFDFSEVEAKDPEHGPVPASGEGGRLDVRLRPRGEAGSAAGEGGQEGQAEGV